MSEQQTQTDDELLRLLFAEEPPPPLQQQQQHPQPMHQLIPYQQPQVHRTEIRGVYDMYLMLTHQRDSHLAQIKKMSEEIRNLTFKVREADIPWIQLRSNQLHHEIKSFIWYSEQIDMIFRDNQPPPPVANKCTETIVLDDIDELDSKYEASTASHRIIDGFVAVDPKSIFSAIKSRRRRVRVSKNNKQPMERSCIICETTTTPEWRTGPNGTYLCNACGIQYKKTEVEFTNNLQKS